MKIRTDDLYLARSSVCFEARASSISESVSFKKVKMTKNKKEIATLNAPAAIGPYSQAVEVNNMVFLSGQIPIDPQTGECVSGGIKEKTLQVFENIKAILSEANLTMDEIVKTTVFLVDMDDFAAMNAVYTTQFSGTFPARSAVAVKTLPKDADVEIEVIAVRSAQS